MNVKEMRELLGLTQTEFAGKYKIPFRTYQSWELGERNPPEYVLFLLERCVLADAKAEGKYIDWAEVLEANEEKIKDAMKEYARKDLETTSVLDLFINSSGEILATEFVDARSTVEFKEAVFHLKTYDSECTDILNEFCDNEQAFSMVMEHMTKEEKEKFAAICEYQETEPTAESMWILKENFPDACHLAEQDAIESIIDEMDFDEMFNEILYGEM
ncbi:MAG: helix-turn-helix domain-containing protein [Anaerotignum sp.]